MLSLPDMDTIFINGLEVFAHHGVLPEEKRDGQTFFLDIALDVPIERASVSDDLDDTVNYDEVCRIAHDAMTSHCFDLIERAGGCVCDALLAAFSLIRSVTVTVRKPFAPLCRKVDYVAVRITRQRSE